MFERKSKKKKVGCLRDTQSLIFLVTICFFVPSKAALNGVQSNEKLSREGLLSDTLCCPTNSPSDDRCYTVEYRQYTTDDT